MTIDGARQSLKTRKDAEEKRVETLHRLREMKKELELLQSEFEKLHEIQKYTKSERE